jgi:hypothetical protein
MELKLGVMVHTCNFNTGEAEAGGSQIHCQHGYIAMSFLKAERKQTTTRVNQSTPDFHSGM